MCTPVQLVEVRESVPVSCHSKKLIDVDDTDKSSESNDTGLYIKSQVDRTSHNILNSKTQSSMPYYQYISSGSRIRQSRH